MANNCFKQYQRWIFVNLMPRMHFKQCNYVKFIYFTFYNNLGPTRLWSKFGGKDRCDFADNDSVRFRSNSDYQSAHRLFHQDLNRRMWSYLQLCRCLWSCYCYFRNWYHCDKCCWSMANNCFKQYQRWIFVNLMPRMHFKQCNYVKFIYFTFYNNLGPTRLWSKFSGKDRCLINHISICIWRNRIRLCSHRLFHQDCNRWMWSFM